MKHFCIDIQEHTLHFKQPAGTSRGVYTKRAVWLLKVRQSGDDLGVEGLGECAPLPDLSRDAMPSEQYAARLRAFADEVEQTGRLPLEALRPYPSMLMGFETALRQLAAAGFRHYDTAFSRGERGIPINGLVWMGSIEEMQQRLRLKLESGARCVKLKIGALDFESELALLTQLRAMFAPADLEIRVDANGGFPEATCLERLEALARLDIHSIEQPIRAGRWGAMAALCRRTPLPIALDEELIGPVTLAEKRALLDCIRPQYVVLKPSLHGGFSGAEEWVNEARRRGIGWWVTSALEGNIGLNAIAQWTAHLHADVYPMDQGLGTGQLFTDNFPAPLAIRDNQLWMTN